MNKLFILAGQSASGKSTIEKLLHKRISDLNLPVKKLTSNTTRPIRDGEANGTDYNFVTLKQFDKDFKHGDVAEYNSFRIDNIKQTWIYYTKKSDIDLASDSLLAVKEPVGIAQLRQQYKNEIVVFYVTCPEGIRRERYISRGSTVDDVDSRFKRDSTAFEYLQYDYEIINDGTYTIESRADLIINLMKGEMNIE